MAQIVQAVTLVIATVTLVVVVVMPKVATIACITMAIS